MGKRTSNCSLAFPGRLQSIDLHHLNLHDAIRTGAAIKCDAELGCRKRAFFCRGLQSMARSLRSRLESSARWVKVTRLAAVVVLAGSIFFTVT